MHEQHDTAERPFMAGPHAMYMVGPMVQVMIFNGDVTLEHMDRIGEFFSRHGGQVVALVRDVGNLGRFSVRARKQLSRVPIDAFKHPDAELRVFLANASVVTRAIFTLSANAVSLVTRKPVKTRTAGSLDEAIAMATRYADEVAARVRSESSRAR